MGGGGGRREQGQIHCQAMQFPFLYTKEKENIPLVTFTTMCHLKKKKSCFLARKTRFEAARNKILAGANTNQSAQLSDTGASYAQGVQIRRKEALCTAQEAAQYLSPFLAGNHWLEIGGP